MERGAGIRQLGMRAAEYQLNLGEWVHIFPEGSRSQNGDLKPLKIGVGRLIAACDHIPLVVPIVHSGMDSVQPRGSSIPKLGKKVCMHSLLNLFGKSSGWSCVLLEM